MGNHSGEEVGNTVTIGPWFKASTLFLLLLALCASFLTGLLRTQNIPELIGYLVGVLLLYLILVAILSIGKRFRTASARYKIIFYSSIVVVLVQALSFVAIIGSKIDL